MCRLLTRWWLRLQGYGSGSSSLQRDVLGSRDPSGSLSTGPITTALAAAAASAPDTHHEAAASGPGHIGDARAEEGSEAAWDAARGELDAPLRARRGVLARLLAPSPGASVAELRCGDAAGVGSARCVMMAAQKVLQLRFPPEGPWALAGCSLLLLHVWSCGREVRLRTKQAPLNLVPDGCARPGCRERGRGEYGCMHYRRRCRMVAPCCGEVFWCRHCHNEVKTANEWVRASRLSKAVGLPAQL